MYKKIKHSLINVSVTNGETVGTGKLHIKEGDVVACALLTDNKPSSSVNIKIEDADGNELHPAVSYKEYQPTNGNHFDSRKPIYFEGNRDIRVTAQSLEPLTLDFNFQVLFYSIKQ